MGMENGKFMSKSLNSTSLLTSKNFQELDINSEMKRQIKPILHA